MIAFTPIVLGHLAGDYLLQSKNMALLKSQPGYKGLLWCVWHCLLYTAAICLFCWRADLVFIGLVFASHFPIDRWSLGDKWLRLICGRDFMKTYKEKGLYWEIHLSFDVLVYTVVDNSLHLILLWLIAKAL